MSREAKRQRALRKERTAETIGSVAKFITSALVVGGIIYLIRRSRRRRD